MVEILPDTTNPFPNGYIDTGYEDKLFKHVLFNTQSSPSKFRIKSIGHDWTEIFEVNTRNVEIPLSDWNFTKDKFRIKSVLSKSDNGILESRWVEQKLLGENRKRKLNQFRVRSITEEGLRSKWVYSEIKDDEDDLVVFQLLHDILDVMSIAHEQDFTAIIETSLSDILIGLLNGSKMSDIRWLKTLDIKEETRYLLEESVSASGMGQHQIQLLKSIGTNESIINEIMRDYLKFQEEREIKINEAVSLVSKYFKKNLIEQKKFSKEEIALHAKLYKLKDVSNMDVLDGMLEHIFLITIEDAYEKAIADSNLVALLQNDEEILSILTDMYTIEAESSLTELFNDVEFVDDFVTFFSDGLKLVLEPNFNEDKISKVFEEAVPTLLLIYKDVFIPLSKLETTMADLFSELDDDATELYNKINSSFNNIKLEYYDENTNETSWLTEEYLVEIFEYLLITDGEVENQINPNLFSIVIGAMKKDYLKMFITFDPVEAIEYITGIVENLKISGSKLNDMSLEEYHLNWSEQTSTLDLISEGSIEDTRKLTNKEDVLLTNKTIPKSADNIKRLFRQESYQIMDLTNFKKILENYTLLILEGHTIQDIFSNKELFADYNLKVLEDTKSITTMNEKELVASHYVAIIHTLITNDTKKYLNREFDIPAYVSYHVDMLYKQNLKDKYTGPFVRRENNEEYELANMFPNFYRYDDYFNVIWNMKEDIHVHLGELELTGKNFPIGYFVLGTNTLTGE